MQTSPLCPSAALRLSAHHSNTTAKTLHRRPSKGLARLAALSLLATIAALQARAQVTSPVMQEVILPMQHPEHGTVDASGNVYIPDYQTGQVYELYAVNGVVPVSPATRTIGAAFGNGNAVGVALDSLGDLYVTNPISNTVSEFVASGGVLANSPTVKTIVSGLTGAGGTGGIAVDSLGDLYFAYSYSQVLEIKATSVGVFPTNPTPINIGASLNVASDVALDASGNVYACDYFGNAIVEIYATSTGVFPATPTTRTLASGLNAPYGVAVDASGDVFYTNSNGNNLQEIVAVGGTIPTSNATVLTLASNPAGSGNPNGLLQPFGVMLGPNGTIYVDDYTGGHVNELRAGAASMGGSNVGTGINATIQVNVAAGTSISSISYLTQGASNLDFKALTPDTSSTLCTAKTYATATTCTVDVTFTPTAPGTRLGAVQFVNGSSVVGTVYVSGTGNGPQVAYLPATSKSLGAIPSGGQNIAVDSAQNIYISTKYGVSKLQPGCASLTCGSAVGGGYQDATGLAVDGAGNVYVADYSQPAIDLVPPGCATAACVVSLGGGFSAPFGVAVDSKGNVYAADTDAHLLKMMPPNCFSSSCVSVIGGGFSSLFGIAVDLSGNVYVADNLYNNKVKQVPPGCTTSACVVTLGGGWGNPGGVAVDGEGNVYVADTNNNLLKMMPPNCLSTACVSTVGALTYATGVAVDAQGNVYGSSAPASTGVVYTVSAAPSLSFASTNLGNTSADSPKTVTIENTGNAALVFNLAPSGTNPAFTGATPASYSLSSGGTCPQVTSSTVTAPTLAAGTSCTWMVSFKPTASTNAASLTVTDNNLNASNATQGISLSGTGTGTPKLNSTLTGPSPQPVLLQAGSAGNFTVTVSGAGSAPSGSITYVIAGACVSNCSGTGAIASGTGVVTLPSTLAPGAYTVAVGYAGDANYNAATGINVSVQVGQLTPTVTYPAQAAITYNATLAGNLNATTAYGATSLTSGGTTTYTAQVGSGPSVMVTAATVLTPGTYTLAATWTPSSANSTVYTTAMGSTTLVVNKAAAGMSGITQVSPLPAGSVGTGTAASFSVAVTNATTGSTGTPTGTVQFYNGAAALGQPIALTGTGSATLTTNFATAQTASLTAVYSGDSNFSGATSAALAEAVVTPGYAVTASATAITVARGTPAAATITLTPAGNYQGAASFSCSGLPAYSACQFTPSTINMTGNNGVQTDTLTIYTMAPSAAPGATRSALPWMPGLLAGVLLLCSRRRRTTAMQRLLLLLFAASMALGLGGCGSGGYVTPTGNDSITVNVTATATAGTGSSNLNQATTIAVTIQ